MALVSPGVQVTVTDQSNYSPAPVGSVAYILMATATNKVAPGGTAYAAGTLAENAGKVYTITSQRDLVTTFGTPSFTTTSGGVAVNGDEQNEYGLMTAYSMLGVSNILYVQRADVDLASLAGTTIRPLANPSNGTYWLDTTNTNWGIYEWDAASQSFAIMPVTVITSSTNLANDVYTPNISIGAIGDYAVNTVDSTNPVFYKRYDNTWQLVGNTGWQQGVPTITSTIASGIVTANANIKINTTNVTVATGANLSTVASAINSASITGVTARVASSLLLITATSSARSNGSTTDGKVAISNGNNTPLSDLGITAGTYAAAASTVSPYNTVPTYDGNITLGNAKPTGSIWQKASITGSGLNTVIKVYDATSTTWVTKTVPDYYSTAAATYAYDPAGGGLNISPGVLFNKYDPKNSNIPGSYLWYRKNSGPTIVNGYLTTPANPSVGDAFTVTLRSNISLATTDTYTVTITTGTPTGFVNAINAASINGLTANILSTGAVSITHAYGSDITLKDTTRTPLANVGIADVSSGGTNSYSNPDGSGSLICSNWAPLSLVGYTVSATQPYVAPANNTYWYYNTPNRIDVMINDGTAWKGYQNVTSDIRGFNLANTNPTGPIAATSAPTLQDDGTPLVYGDLWLDTSDLENYPRIRRWQNVNGINTWVLIDNTDNSSQNGIVFADARWSTTGNVNPVTASIESIADLAKSNYIDLDAPSYSLYPRGTLLFNTRASGYNVKQYKSAYFTTAAYPNQSLPARADTWISEQGYSSTGSPNFGRNAQRGVIVAALKSSIDSSTSLREDQNVFNLIACPGYPELIPNMVTLNEDKDNTAFIVGDTPLRLPATGTAIQAWANNSNGASGTGEVGLETTSPYVGVFYPSGLTNDLSGNNIVVPPSYAALRAILKSDNISYPWLAPAGTRRGLIDNISAIGYIDPVTGSFISIGVTQGLRDIMYTNRINPMTNLPGAGLVVYGQKTLASTPSSMDRINISRLVNYLRTQLNTLARPFIFEPNDPITRNAVKAVVSSLMNDLVAKRGITDYLVVCDGTNNTADRITRNELYVDVAIQPTKDVEFIYIPIRLKNPGEIQGGNIASATAVGTGA